MNPTVKIFPTRLPLLTVVSLGRGRIFSAVSAHARVSFALRRLAVENAASHSPASADDDHHHPARRTSDDVRHAA